MAYKIYITRPSQCCMNTYTPQKRTCPLRWLLFILSYSYKIHYSPQRISNHLMADKIYEINFLLMPVIYVTGTFKMIKSYHTWYGCNDMLFSTYLMWSFEVSHYWPDIKHQWALIIAQKDHPSPVSVIKSELLEMARMICSF